MEVRDIIEKIRVQMEDPDFLKRIGNALRGQNKEEFQKEVSNRLEKIFAPEDKLLETLHFYAGGIHYISPSLGEWFRFNFGENIKPSNKLIADELDSAYKAVPKEYNLTTLDELKKSVKYSFTEKVEGTFLVNKETRSKLFKCVFPETGVNYFEYVTGGNYSEEKGRVCESVKNTPDFEKDLKPTLEKFRQYLKDKVSNPIKGEDHLFRLLSFSCIFTLLKLCAEDLEDEVKKNYAFGLIVPFRVPYSNIIEQGKLQNYGGFGGIFSDSLQDEEIHSLTVIFEYIVNRLICLETGVFAHKGLEDLIAAEDTIRLCTRIDNGRVEVLKNRYTIFLKAIVERHLKELHTSNPPDGNLIKTVIDDKISKKFIGCNEYFIETLQRILVTIKKEYEEFRKVLDSTSEEKSYCSTIFLYGEEGVGKEILTKVCHLINPRYYMPRYVLDIIKQYHNNYYSEQTGELKDEQSFKKILEIGKIQYNITKKAGGKEEIKWDSLKLSDDRFFNYRNINAATLDSDSFSKIIFGEKIFSEKISQPAILGELEICSVLGGTLFLDEIDKLDSKLANQLLKVLESPYFFQRHGEKKDRQANLLIVFASNKRLEEFTHDTFSSAFIYRIGRNYFEIPPLRTRREDIALFIANSISKNNKENKVKKTSGEYKEIKSIDLRGLRLLCELPWLNNYRGLDSFIRTLFMEREIRHINSSEISFDEIISIVRKLELLKKKSPQ